MGVAVSWSTCLRCNHTSSRHFFSVSKSCMSPVQTRLEWLQTASNQIQCNYLQYRTTKSQTVIAILCATATVVRGADGHKTDLCFGGRNQTNINQSYLYYMHHTTVKQLDITNWNLGLLLVVQWWIIISTPSFVLRWTKNLRKQGGKSLSTTLNQCPFSIMLGTQQKVNVPQPRLLQRQKVGIGLGFLMSLQFLRNHSLFMIKNTPLKDGLKWTWVNTHPGEFFRVGSYTGPYHGSVRLVSTAKCAA